MKPRTSQNFFSSKVAYLCLTLICLFSAAIPAQANRQGNVVVRENVSIAKRKELVNKLRAITGLSRLNFDSDGILRLSAEQPDKGSRSARQLLDQAVGGRNVIVIEDASSSPDVAFCRVVPGRWIQEDKANSPAYVILIDFADFRHVLGDREAQAAFDVGWGFLHELDHVVSDSEDADTEGVLGDCEGHINAMRSELGLPRRAEYFFTPASLRTDPNFGTRLVRLAFEQHDAKHDRTRRYWLIWDSTAVGGMVAGRETTALSSTSFSPK